MSLRRKPHPIPLSRKFQKLPRPFVLSLLSMVCMYWYSQYFPWSLHFSRFLGGEGEGLYAFPHQSKKIIIEYFVFKAYFTRSLGYEVCITPYRNLHIK
jgi:hypothetical protein